MSVSISRRRINSTQRLRTGPRENAQIKEARQVCEYDYNSVSCCALSSSSLHSNYCAGWAGCVRVAPQKTHKSPKSMHGCTLSHFSIVHVQGFHFHYSHFTSYSPPLSEELFSSLLISPSHQTGASPSSFLSPF